VYLTEFTHDTMCSWRLQPQVELGRTEETRYVPGKDAHGLDIWPIQLSADVVEYRGEESE
jgi:hypothetical protein